MKPKIPTRLQIAIEFGIDQETISNNIKSMSQDQVDNIINYNAGFTLHNSNYSHRPTVKAVTTFKLNGYQYSTNLNRSKQYSLNDRWEVIPFPLYKKIWWVLTGKVKKLNPCKKSVLAGI